MKKMQEIEYIFSHKTQTDSDIEFEKKNIEIIEHNIIDSEDDLNYIMDKGFNHAPVIELENGDMMKYADALKWIGGI